MKSPVRIGSQSWGISSVGRLQSSSFFEEDSEGLVEETGLEGATEETGLEGAAEETGFEEIRLETLLISGRGMLLSSRTEELISVVSSLFSSVISSLLLSSLSCSEEISEEELPGREELSSPPVG